jgi:hypothetical protein
MPVTKYGARGGGFGLSVARLLRERTTGVSGWDSNRVTGTGFLSLPAIDRGYESIAR